ncbi:MAG TPA: hypothetical protein VJU77_05560 [Chthoniobacterales bacterium]|nr:hypothetical protein [Chthoniobacterales bacterium]
MGEAAGDTEVEADGAALGRAEGAGLVAGGAGLVVGGTTPAGELAGFTDEEGAIPAGVGLVPTAEGVAVEEASGLGVAVGVAEVVATGGGRFFFTRSVRLLGELLFCA